MAENKPDIAVYLYRLQGGGAERIMVNLMQGFVQRGLKIDLVVNKKEGPLLTQVPSSVRIIDLSAPKPWRNGLPKLMGYLQKERPKTLLTGLHYNNEIAILAKRLAFASTRVVVSEHNTLSLRVKREKNEQKSALTARLFYPFADAVLAVSQGVAKDLSLVTGMPLNRIKTLYNPVILPDLIEKAKQPVDHPWFAPGEPPVILGVGRLEQQKDFPTLIKSFAIVRQVQPARLVILGQGKEQQKLNALVKELGIENDVAFLGFTQNPYAYMAKASVFVLSSIEEGLPTVLIEAMAVGTPVVSTNCKSGPDEILDNSKYGELVPVGDREAIAQAIFRLFSGNAKSVPPAWLEQYSLETVTQQYLDLLGISPPP